VGLAVRSVMEQGWLKTQAAPTSTETDECRRFHTRHRGCCPYALLADAGFASATGCLIQM